MSINYHERLLEVLNSNKDAINISIEKLVRVVSEVAVSNNHVWLIGNGGSASTVEHFEVDLSFVKNDHMRSFSKISALTSNSALITATANDIDFSHLFSLILQRKAQKNDLLIALSASGNSENIINCVKKANQMGLKTFSVIGFNGGKLKGLANDEIIVSSNIGEYEVVEDIHLSIFHAVKMKLIEMHIN